MVPPSMTTISMVSRNVLRETLLFVDTFFFFSKNPIGGTSGTEHVVTFSRAPTDAPLYTVDEGTSLNFSPFPSTLGAHIRTQAARSDRNTLNDPQWTVFPQSSHTACREKWA